jgi:hypothetical protein
MKHTGLGIGIATSPPSPELSGPGLPAATTFENDYDYYNGINDPFMLDGRCAFVPPATKFWRIGSLLLVSEKA